MTLTYDNISQSKIAETTQFVFKPTNIGLLIEKYYFAIIIGPQFFWNNKTEHTKTYKYFHLIN